MTSQKTRVLVLFGGRSPEHDVSIISGLQAMAALDPERYEAIPLYIAPDGAWLVGEALRERGFYIPSEEQRAEKLTPVTLNLTPGKTPYLVTRPRSVWQKARTIPFDVAMPVFHGLVGEDGQIQGLFEVAGAPYVGMRTMASAVLMDKAATKRMMAGTGVPQLAYHEIRRPAQGVLLTVNELEPILKGATFPACIKPAHLGSSIGVAQVKNLQEVSDVLAASIFPYDDLALLEPFVENLVEYNVAVCRVKGKIVTSAIERPKRSSELLDFKTKYMSGGNGKQGGGKAGGAKTPGQSSEGMLSLTREINPKIPEAFEANLRKWAVEVFSCVVGSGAPRLDFMCNSATGEAWFNEANPCPGSFGYFLWEAATRNPMLFSELLDNLIAEALELHRRAQIPLDPTPQEARLFPRK
ncbi:MAG: D-alanine--D-alanine ligase [Bdellovibrionales bacterium]